MAAARPGRAAPPRPASRPLQVLLLALLLLGLGTAGPAGGEAKRVAVLGGVMKVGYKCVCCAARAWGLTGGD